MLELMRIILLLMKSKQESSTIERNYYIQLEKDPRGDQI